MTQVTSAILIKVIIVLWIFSTAALIVVYGLAYVRKMSASDLASTRIVIHLSDDLQKLDLQFGLLHIRDGVDQQRDSGPLRNTEMAFAPVDRHGTLEVVVTYQKRLGFQFKCFVDAGSRPFDEVSRLLAENGFVDVSPGQGVRSRIWFILNEYPTVETDNKPPFKNNFFYPA